MTKIELGSKVRDRVSGLEGIAVSRIEYLNGCVQYSVQPLVDPDKPYSKPDVFWVDVEQIEVVGPGVRTEHKPTGGGFRDHPPTKN